MITIDVAQNIYYVTTEKGNSYEYKLWPTSYKTRDDYNAKENLQRSVGALLTSGIKNLQLARPRRSF